MSDFANLAAANAAGWVEIVSHKPDGSYLVTLEKQMAGAPGASGYMMRGYGAGSTQAAAEAQALADINGQRRTRYAGGSSIPASSSDFQWFGGGLFSPGGTTLTQDVS